MASKIMKFGHSKSIFYVKKHLRICSSILALALDRNNLITSKIKFCKYNPTVYVQYCILAALEGVQKQKFRNSKDWIFLGVLINHSSSSSRKPGESPVTTGWNHIWRRVHCCRLQVVYSLIIVKNFVTVYTAFNPAIEVIYFWDYKKKSS